jgi:cell division transport system permease protein
LGLLRRAIYFLRKAVGSLRENPFINLVTIGTIAIAMTLFGAFLLVFVNMKAVVDRLGGDVEISAYLRDDASAAAVGALGERLKRIPEVSDVRFVSKADALAIFKKNNPEDLALLQELGENPFPASYQVRLAPGHRDAESVARIAKDLGGDSAVDEVEYGQEWIERFSAFLKLLQAGGIALGLMLVVAVVFVVSNTIKLAVFARRDELEIMQLVGATALFIRVPYLIEGLIQGGAGALLALAALWAAWRGLAPRAVESFAPVFGTSHIDFIPGRQALELVAGGMLLGVLGSFFAMGRFLRGPKA